MHKTVDLFKPNYCIEHRDVYFIHIVNYPAFHF